MVVVGTLRKNLLEQVLMDLLDSLTTLLLIEDIIWHFEDCVDVSKNNINQRNKEIIDKL